MDLFSFRQKEGVLHVPVLDIATVLKRADGSGVISFKVHTGLGPLTVKSADAVIDAMRKAGQPPVPGEPPRPVSLFEAIFGR